jgi:hypothetical protein
MAKKKKLLDSMIIKKRIDELAQEFVLLSVQAKKMSSEGSSDEEIDNVYIQMANVFDQLQGIVEKELRIQNPELKDLFDALLHFRSM